jgi:hypothetical protein
MSLKEQIDIGEIENLIPHRKPFLLIDKLIDIVPMISATGVMNIKNSDFFFSRALSRTTSHAWSFNCRGFWSNSCLIDSL